MEPVWSLRSLCSLLISQRHPAPLWCMPPIACPPSEAPAWHQNSASQLNHETKLPKSIASSATRTPPGLQSPSTPSKKSANPCCNGKSAHSYACNGLRHASDRKQGYQRHHHAPHRSCAHPHGNAPKKASQSAVAAACRKRCKKATTVSIVRITVIIRP
jgi:hypothetical protein